MPRQTLSTNEQEWSNAERNLLKQIHELNYKLTSLERTSHDKENKSERQLQASAEYTRSHAKKIAKRDLHIAEHEQQVQQQHEDLVLYQKALPS